MLLFRILVRLLKRKEGSIPSTSRRRLRRIPHRPPLRIYSKEAAPKRRNIPNFEREKPDAKLPTREELRVKTTEQSKEQFDLLVSAWSRERKASTNNIAMAIWDEKLKLAKVVKQKGKSLSKFGYSAAASTETGAAAATVTTTTFASSADNGGGRCICSQRKSRS